MNQTLRTFALHPEANGAGESWDLIATTNATDETVARFSGRRLERSRHALTNAITTSKHPRTSLSPTRRAPILLTEDAGVRLALTYLATAPIAKPDRADAIRHGIDAMTSEEALYWYALCTGSDAPRALRALRTLLAK